MRLGEDDIKITVGNEALFLRPSLRAAHRLEQKYDGFHNLYREVEAGSLTAISDIVKQGSGHTSALTDYLDCPDAQPLMIDLATLGAQVGTFLVSLTGVENAIATTKGEAISYLEYHTRLFQIATGWLGWSPDQAWSATPAEIIAAQQGVMEKLKAVYGGANSDGDTIERGEDGKVDRDAIASLNAIGDMTITEKTQ